jgi:hypothetical protein
MKAIAATLTLLVLAGTCFAQDKTAPKDTIDIVFCIDCSGSMGPVIDTAKLKVWAIVNEIAKDRPKAALRIGLIGYGNADRSYRKFDLSDDLDEVYKNLVTFKDEGWGDEWVGLVVHKAVKEMKWTDAKNVLKIIFVVGNETARQGPEQFDYTKTAKEAIEHDIIVNAIYCGKGDPVTEQASWKEMAKIADGSYTEIEGQGGAVSIATPFDQELAELGAKLNGTYIGYGARGREAKQNQEAQDANAAKCAPTPAPMAPGADRACAKASAQYNNRSWDLVDACKEKEFKLSEVKPEELPDEMQKMTPEERKAYVETKTKEREEIQAKIKDLAAKREAYIKDEMSKKGLNAEKAFDQAVRKTLCEQANRKGENFAK